MTEYVVYLLRSEKDGNYYIGYTSNLKHRLKMHETGKVKSTKNRRPVILLGYKKFFNKNKARYFEYLVKHHSDQKRKFIEDILHRSI